MTNTATVSDAAVEAAANGAHQELLSMASEMRLPMKYTESISVGNYRVMRAAITAAIPHLALSPAEPAQGEQWQDIETAPKDGTVIDLWANPSKLGFARYPDYTWDNTHWCQYGLELMTIDPCDVSHWMPLPAAPTLSAGRTTEGGE